MDGYKLIVNKSSAGRHRQKVREVIRRETTHPFSVVSNPEFLKQGAAVDDFMKPDRVVIGAEDPRGAELMVTLYQPFTRTGAPIMVMDCASAELSKYAANALLASRISFMNEIANVCEKFGADVDRVRQAVGSTVASVHRFFSPVSGTAELLPEGCQGTDSVLRDPQLRLQGLEGRRGRERPAEGFWSRSLKSTSDRSRVAPSESGGWPSSPRPMTCVRHRPFQSSKRSSRRGRRCRLMIPKP